MKHTPEPWKIEFETDIVGPKGKLVATVADCEDLPACNICPANAALIASAPRLAREHQAMREALVSIAKNTCCTTCQEAAVVARNALGWRHQCLRCGSWGPIVNACGCDPDNLPTRAIIDRIGETA